MKKEKGKNKIKAKVCLDINFNEKEFDFDGFVGVIRGSFNNFKIELAKFETKNFRKTIDYRK